MSQNQKRFYGKYRGKVSQNIDPLNQGRIRAKVPPVFGDKETGWALPCSPYAGNGVGFFFIPPVDANVWIEFEDGNPESPIWAGGFWGVGEVPKIPALPDVKIIKTDFATITISDLPLGLTIETTNSLKITMDLTGIELKNSNAKIKMTPISVSVNDGALDVI